MGHFRNHHRWECECAGCLAEEPVAQRRGFPYPTDSEILANLRKENERLKRQLMNLLTERKHSDA